MIRRLPPEIVREIAAGEVVFSVADVVRELLENALDAGASRVRVELWGGGLDRIVVQDNGVGIPLEELPLAVEPHATSKLERLDQITTLGFRGEGLYAIRQAGQLTLISRPAQQLGAGRLWAQGEQVELGSQPAPAGTRVEVAALLAHLPARRRALESPQAEVRHTVALLSRYLLHHPALALSLWVDGEERLQFPGGSVVQAAQQLWGSVMANRLLSLELEDHDLALRGLISRPELTRPRRDRLWLAVGGRPVDWPEPLLAAVLRAYRELLPAGQFPVGVLNLNLPPGQVVQHTSPNKSRLRLLQPEPVVALVTAAVTRTLSAHPLARPLPQPAALLAPSQASTPFPALKYLGTYRQLYLLAEADSDLYVIDQHAAHERIVYEELERRYQAEPPLELPGLELITLLPEEEAAYLERLVELENLGIVLEPFGPATYRIRQLPAFLAPHPTLAPQAVSSCLGGGSLEEAWRRVLARLACLPAIRAGHRLAQAEAQALLHSLAACQMPWVCPHGRPTVLRLAELELARRFGRRAGRAVSLLPHRPGEIVATDTD